VAAYKELEASCGGKQIPSFHGSWTCHVPTQSPLGLKMRPVRLILIEYLRGSSLLDLKPTLYSEQNRLNIVAQAMEAWVTIHHEGVSQGDFSPRNVLLCEPLDGDSRVAIVDFSLSVVGRLASGKCHKDRFKLPLSPLARFIGDSNDFIAAGWLPESFSWMWERWDGDCRYEPIPDNIRKRQDEGKYEPKDWAAQMKMLDEANEKVKGKYP
jgi:serine/threonine protein kinase